MASAGQGEPRLSVVIPALNEETRLGPTLEALARQTAPCSSFEVIVADGGSTDGTVAMAERAGAQVVVCPRGPGRQRNCGARTARAEWLAFLDADCTPAEDWVEVALEHIDRQDADLLGAPVLTPQGGTWVQRAWATHLASRRSAASISGHGSARYLTTANLIVSRSTYDGIGGFSEDLSSGEDYLFMVTAEARGARVLCDPCLVVTHRGEPGTLRQFWRQQVWHSNGEAWKRIAQATEGRVGGKARLYGLVVAALGAALVVATAVGVWTGLWWITAIAIAANAALPLALALRTARNVRAPQLVPALAFLYWLFGCARAAHIIGAARIIDKRDRFRHAGN